MNVNDVKKATENFAKILSGKLGDELEAVLIYGSIAKDDFQQRTSDHNVALILKDDSAAHLRHIASAMRHSRPSKKTGLLLLTHEELKNARDVFPLKLRDISRHHITLHGNAAGLTNIEVDNKHLALDVESQMRGLVIRLRRLFIQGDKDLKLLRQNLVGAFKAFLPPMGGLAELSGQGQLKTKQDIVNSIGNTLGVADDAARTLMRMLLAEGAPKNAAEYNILLDGTTQMMRAAAEKADAMGEA